MQFTHTPGAPAPVVSLSVGEGACTATTTRTIPLRPNLEIAFELATPAVCANGTGTFYIDNYDSFEHVSVYVTNGRITSVQAGRVPGGRLYTFENNGAGDTRLQIYANPRANECIPPKDVTVTTNAAATVGIRAMQVHDDAGFGAIVSNSGGVVEVCGDPTVRLVPTVLNQANTYRWSNGATTAVLDVRTSGTYTLTMTDANGCVATASVTVNYTAYPPKPAITAPATELCPAGGSITLTAPAASGWLWSNGATTQSIVVTAPGSYRVRVRNGLCESPESDPVVITSGTSAISVSGTTELCANGSVTLTANGGTSWLWSNGATAQSITVNAPGSYSVTTSNNGCAMAPSAPVVVTQRSMSVSANGPTTFCDGESVTLTASGGTSWLWSNGATTRSITVVQSGNYSVTGTFADGCSIESAPVAVEARAVAATITSDRTSVCPGGSIQFDSSVSGGSGYTYQWYDQSYAPIAGATAPQLTHAPTQSGFVYLKVTDVLGCQATSNAILITVEPTPEATITAPASVCQGSGGSASVADAGPNATYSWSITNGTIVPSGRTASFSPSGTSPMQISVTVSNPGCSTTGTATVSVNPLPDATITPNGSTALCPNGSVRLSAPAGYASYRWSNGATTDFIDVPYASAGTFTVTVTDANGCSRQSAPTTVTQNAATAITTQPLSQTMPRHTTRTLTVGATGTATLLYQWYEGAVGDMSKPKGTSSSQVVGPFQKKGTYRFWVRVWSSTCTSSSANSQEAVITVN